MKLYEFVEKVQKEHPGLFKVSEYPHYEPSGLILRTSDLESIKELVFELDIFKDKTVLFVNSYTCLIDRSKVKHANIEEGQEEDSRFVEMLTWQAELGPECKEPNFKNDIILLYQIVLPEYDNRRIIKLRLANI